MYTSRIGKKIPQIERWRKAVHWLWLTLFFVLPQLGLVLFDFEANRLYFFGLTFVKGEFQWLFLQAMGAYFLLMLIAVLYNKLFCGWICPQNIFYEMFSRVDSRLKRYFVFYRQSLRLQKGADKLFAAFVALSLGWGSLQYLHAPNEIFATVLFVLIFLWTYIDLSYFKHSFCKVACPYAYVQKMLQSQDGLQVQYSGGDCGSCQACQKACYVDLDIRKTPFHMDCTLCGACVQACATVFRNREEAPYLSLGFGAKKSGFFGLNTTHKWVVALTFCAVTVFGITSLINKPKEYIQIKSMGQKTIELIVNNFQSEKMSYTLHMLSDDYSFESGAQTVTVFADGYGSFRELIVLLPKGKPETISTVTFSLKQGDAEVFFREMFIMFEET